MKCNSGSGQVEMMISDGAGGFSILFLTSSAGSSTHRSRREKDDMALLVALREVPKNTHKLHDLGRFRCLDLGTMSL